MGGNAKAMFEAGLACNRVRAWAVCIAACLLAGCGSPSGGTTVSAHPSPLVQKLESMTPDQRVEYAKTHMDEVRADAGVKVPDRVK